MSHSLIVGGSTAKRVINCPGSVALVATMPPQPGSSYANEGSLLHEAIAIVMDTACAPEDSRKAAANRPGVLFGQRGADDATDVIVAQCYGVELVRHCRRQKAALSPPAASARHRAPD